MRGEVFFDTSVLAYLLVTDDPRSAQAEALLREGGSISVQVLNEFTAVARRKAQMPWDEIEEVLAAIRTLCAAPLPLTLATHDAGLRIAKRFGFRIYDALILASAAESGCAILYSEDMQDGQVIGSVTVRNPFVKSGATRSPLPPGAD